MLAALRTGLGKLPGSRMVALGTRPADESHWFSRWLADGADYRQLHAAGPDDPPFRKRTWLKANPSLAFMPELESTIRGEAEAAKREESELAAFRALRLNQGTSDVTSSNLIAAEAWQACEALGAGDPDGPMAWGIDLGTSAAMSAVACYWPRTGRLEALACFPEKPTLEERERKDRAHGVYTALASRRELIIEGDRVSDIGALLTAARGRWGDPAVLACDRWREAELRQVLEALRFPWAKLSVRGQGFKDGGEDVRLFRAACLSDRVRPPVSLLLRHALGNARTVQDPAGNSKLAKAGQGGRFSRARDDAAAAAILAVSEGGRSGESTRPRALYHGRT